MKIKVVGAINGAISNGTPDCLRADNPLMAVEGATPAIPPPPDEVLTLVDT